MSVNGLGFGSYGGYLACYSTEYAPVGVIYPTSSGITYMSGSISVGGVLNGDSLVSQDYWAEFMPTKTTMMRTINERLPYFSPLAVSEQDIINDMSDTSWYDIIWQLPPDNRPPKPLHIEVVQSSYAWSYQYAGDFILFKLQIRNIGTKSIHQVYVGLMVEPDARYGPGHDTCCYDDIGGFLPAYEASVGCDRIDTVNIMWGADNDGDPINGAFLEKPTYVNGKLQNSVTGVTGVMFLDWPHSIDVHPHLSYNWWYGWAPTLPAEDDFMPQHKDNFRSWSRPFTDKLYYYTMANGEIDYNQIYAATKLPSDPIWTVPREEIGKRIAGGSWSMSHMLSLGPFELPPGDVLEIPFAYVGGEHFHHDPSNGENLPYNPAGYYRKLDFSDLVKNSQWARWIYDTPGFDTNSDGYAGEYDICPYDSEYVDGHWEITGADTVYYKGDGVPDWKASGPPPAPFVAIRPIVGGLHVRFNGSRSETEKDIFSKIVDFEGYRVYMGRDDRPASFSLMASYDKRNYDKYMYDDNRGGFVIRDIPFTLDSLRCLYGKGPDPCSDTTFDPLIYTRTYPFHPTQYPDSMLFFLPHDNNTSEFGKTTPIRKVYPNEPDPRTLPFDSLTSDRYTPEGNFKYFEYEMDITTLLPTVPYWISVTAFDFGSPASNLGPLESSIVNNAVSGFPYGSEDELPGGSHKIYVYPNPYRAEAGYRSQGYEGRTRQDRPDNRVRALNFANLPPRCTISIYTLDGDLVRRIEHDVPSNDANSTHDSWDLITRNTEMVVSGLYYWVVESPDGATQIGKFVVIM
jgi:hypothetical protein